LADVEVKEARERVRAALQNSGLEFSHNKRITVNLAPADLPKESGRFDLPIALGILAASGQIDAQRLAGFEFAGELSLAGDLRPVRGALAMALALRRRSAHAPRALVLPLASAEEAALVEGLTIYAAAHLLDVVRALLPGDAALSTPLPLAHPQTRASAPVLPDMRDVKGQTGAKRALEIAAAGGHSVLMMGSTGTGKSMLAQRFTGLLPPLTQDDALESAAVLSLTGAFRHEQWGQRVLRAPHHTASSVALVGGGSPPRPGEISLAHHGVLFLDEFPSSSALRWRPCANRWRPGASSSRGPRAKPSFRPRFQLIAAMNPCPCGHLGSPLRACRCTPDAVARYQGRISGPLLDRIDLQVEVPAVPPEALAATPDGEPSAMISQRVAAARARALERQGGTNATVRRCAGSALRARGARGQVHAGRRRTARLVGARFSSRAACGPHHRRSGRWRCHSGESAGRGDSVPAGVGGAMRRAGASRRVQY
jgi:magnesium chelatase family protein